MPFMFIPINSIAYAELPPQKTNEGSALINVARNLGGSVGVSLAATELVQRSQFHQARLTENLSASSPVYQSTVHQLMQYFGQTGPPASAQSHALGYIGQLVEGQAALMAYIDIFFTWSIFAAALVPLTLVLIRRVGPASAGAAVGH
jgi:DHA2 family multidrug resistance protein